MKNIVLVKGSVVGSVGEGGGREEEGGGFSVATVCIVAEGTNGRVCDDRCYHGDSRLGS